MFFPSDVFFLRYTLHLFFSNPSLFFSQRCILLKVYFTSILFQPVLIFLSEMYSSQGILCIYSYPTRPYFSLRDVFYSKYTLHLLLSNPFFVLSQMYSTQGIRYVNSFPTRPYFSLRCILLKVYFTSILIQPILISMSDVLFSRCTLHLFLSNPSLYLCQMYYSQGILYI